MTGNKITFLLFLVMATVTCYAQDIHFSQFNASPLNLNPALTGGFDGDLRAIGNHKRQWMSFTNAYQTFSASVDARLNPLKFGRSFIAVGLLFNTDKAGDAAFGTNQIKLSGSYNIMLTQDSALSGSIGINGGFNQHSINYNALTFGSQFDGNQFDPQLFHGETFNNDNINYLDVSAGLGLSYIFTPKFSANTGISFNHINKPKQSFWDVNSVQLDQKFTIHGGVEWKFTRDLTLFPSAVYQRQGRLQELDLGALLKMNIDNVSFHAIYFGGWMRAQDAGIVEFRFDYRSFNFGISYDINYSKLNVASQGKGGIELSIIYIFKKYREVKLPYYKKCPVYM
ncbi:MAG: PorP/SprF family type IX secretion system membrane protein [Bacteroidia bacterium]|nr:PorP/SprF family type IX secretion system membrane protein [Bacteroidia bacterium]